MCFFVFCCKYAEYNIVFNPLPLPTCVSQKLQYKLKCKTWKRREMLYKRCQIFVNISVFWIKLLLLLGSIIILLLLLLYAYSILWSLISGSRLISLHRSLHLTNFFVCMTEEDNDLCVLTHTLHIQSHAGHDCCLCVLDNYADRHKCRQVTNLRENLLFCGRQL